MKTLLIAKADGRVQVIELDAEAPRPPTIYFPA
jgi:hypothetical protein